MSHPILGLDLGSRRVKAVLLETTLRGFTVTGAAEAPIPPADGGRPAGRGAHVRGRRRACWPERGWTPDVAAVASLPGAAASHLVTLPFTDARRIEQTVQYEVEAAIPFDLDQVAWDWQVAGVPARPLRPLRRRGPPRGARRPASPTWPASGMDPAVVTPGGPVLAALWAAGAVADPAAAGEAELAVDVGADRTHACVVSEGRCLFARTFASGGSTLLRAAARASGRNPDEVVLDEGLPAWLAGPEGDAALRGALGPLVRELRATLHAFEARPSRRPVVRVRLAGGAAGLAGRRRRGGRGARDPRRAAAPRRAGRRRHPGPRTRPASRSRWRWRCAAGWARASSGSTCAVATWPAPAPPRTSATGCSGSRSTPRWCCSSPWSPRW